jgi:hypothetical protein
MEAARAANAHDFIMGLPNQYDTPVGERGVQLSGGERQRISVARAFLKNAPILILDEPTSSIDSATEAVILDALDRLMVGRTTFVIAHRLSTVRNADVIFVMDHGHMVQQGHPRTLLQQSGLYRQLYDAQVGQVQRRVELETPAEPSGRMGDAVRYASTLLLARLRDRPIVERELTPLPEPLVPEALLTSAFEDPSPEIEQVESPYRVEWLTHRLPDGLEAGHEYGMTVEFRNASPVTWASEEREDAAYPVLLSYHWLEEERDDLVEWDGLRSPLREPVAPGEVCTIADACLATPSSPGSYRLQLTLIHEGVSWFEICGAETCTIPVEVLPSSEEDLPSGSPTVDGKQENGHAVVVVRRRVRSA